MCLREYWAERQFQPGAPPENSSTLLEIERYLDQASMYILWALEGCTFSDLTKNVVQVIFR